MKILAVSLLSFLGGVGLVSLLMVSRGYRVYASQRAVLSAATQIPTTPQPTADPTSSPSPTPTATPFATVKPKPAPTGVPTAVPTAKPMVTPTPSPKPQPKADVAVPAWQEEYFTRFADEYHVDKNMLIKIADCESHFNTQARNGDYLGMFQFATQTWITHRTAMGMDPTESKRTSAEESIRTAAFVVSRNGTGPWANCAA